MSISLALAIYGAIVSSVLGVLQILKHFRDNRFIEVDATFGWVPNESLNHEIWIMNRGAGSVSVRELSIGTGIVKGLLRRIEPDCSTSLLDLDEYENPVPLVLGPGEAKHFVFSAVAVRKQYLELSDLIGKKKVDDRSTVQILEVLHSRSNRWIIRKLNLRGFSFEDLDAFPLIGKSKR